MNKKTKNPLLVICITAMLSAIAFVLMLWEFPVAPIPAAAHLKMDLSDIPALFGAIVFGPGAGIIIEFIKNALELLIKGMGTQMGFGNMMNFIVGCAYIVPFSLIYGHFKKRFSENKTILLSCIIGAISIVLVGIGTNYFITPLFFKYFYGTVVDSPALWAAIGTATLINTIKGIMLSIVSVPVIKVLVKRLKKII